MNKFVNSTARSDIDSLAGYLKLVDKERGRHPFMP